MKINLDGLNPSNTFERRILEALAKGEIMPVNVIHQGGDTAALEARVAALEAQSLDIMKAVQAILQKQDDDRRRQEQVRSVIVTLADRVDQKLRAG